MQKEEKKNWFLFQNDTHSQQTRYYIFLILNNERKKKKKKSLTTFEIGATTVIRATSTAHTSRCSDCILDTWNGKSDIVAFGILPGNVAIWISQPCVAGDASNRTNAART